MGRVTKFDIFLSIPVFSNGPIVYFKHQRSFNYIHLCSGRKMQERVSLSIGSGSFNIVSHRIEKVSTEIGRQVALARARLAVTSPSSTQRVFINLSDSRTVYHTTISWRK